MDDRPPVSPPKLLSQFRDWTAETELPGRTMSYLKTGGLPDVLAAQNEREGVAGMLEAWSGWEAGTTGPTSVLEVLRERGLESLLVELAGA